MEKHRLKAAELQSELEKIRRQYNNEKMEREAALAELKRYSDAISFLSSFYSSCKFNETEDNYYCFAGFKLS